MRRRSPARRAKAPNRPAAPAGRDGFDRLLRAEWTKLRSVRRWRLGVVAGLVLTVLIAALIGASSSTNVNDFPDGAGDDDIIRNSLQATVFCLVAVTALAVVFITSEFKQGMIRTTLAATPRRGRVLIAKAVVIGTAAFVVGLGANVAAFLVAQPLLHGNGFEPPPTRTSGADLARSRWWCSSWYCRRWSAQRCRRPLMSSSGG